MSLSNVYKVRLPVDAVKWFRETHGEDASLGWILSGLLNSYKDLHIEQNTSLKAMLDEASLRTQDSIGDMK